MEPNDFKFELTKLKKGSVIFRGICIGSAVLSIIFLLNGIDRFSLWPAYSIVIFFVSLLFAFLIPKEYRNLKMALTGQSQIILDIRYQDGSEVMITSKYILRKLPIGQVQERSTELTGLDYGIENIKSLVELNPIGMILPGGIKLQTATQNPKVVSFSNDILKIYYSAIRQTMYLTQKNKSGEWNISVPVPGYSKAARLIAEDFIKKIRKHRNVESYEIE